MKLDNWQKQWLLPGLGRSFHILSLSFLLFLLMEWEKRGKSKKVEFVGKCLRCDRLICMTVCYSVSYKKYKQNHPLVLWSLFFHTHIHTHWHFRVAGQSRLVCFSYQNYVSAPHVGTSVFNQRGGGKETEKKTDKREEWKKTRFEYG